MCEASSQRGKGEYLGEVLRDTGCWAMGGQWVTAGPRMLLSRIMRPRRHNVNSDAYKDSKAGCVVLFTLHHAGAESAIEASRAAE